MSDNQPSLLRFEEADEYCLGILPKGSTCSESKRVPARSSYWRDETDEVERCARYATGGERRSEPSGSGGDGEPSDGDEDAEDDAEDLPDVPDVQDLGDGSVTLDTSDWSLVLDALREAASDFSRADKAMSAIKLKEAADTLADQSGETRDLTEQVKGDWKFVARALYLVASAAERDDDPADAVEDLRRIADSIVEQRDDEEIPPISRDDLPQVVGDKDEGPGFFTLDRAQADRIEWVWIGDRAPLSPATVPSSVNPSLTVRVRSHGGQFKHRFTADRRYVWSAGDESKNTTITTAKGSHRTPEENRQRAIDGAVKWMEGVLEFVKPDRVGEWEQVSEDPPAWEAEWTDPFTDETVEGRVEIREEEWRDDTIYRTRFTRSDEHEDFGDGKNLGTDQTEREAVEDAERWMESHQPSDEFAFDVPSEVNGWNRDSMSEGRVVYSTWVAPTRARPGATQRVISMSKQNDGKWRPRAAFVDAEGEEVNTYKPDTFTKSSSSMTGRSRGTTTITSNDPKRILDALVEYMEETEPQRVEFTDMPRFEVTFSNDTTKPLFKVLDRFAPENPSSRDWTVAEVDEGGSIDFDGTDSSNVLMYRLSLLLSEAESVDVQRAGEPFAIRGNAIAQASTNERMSETVTIRTEYHDEQNRPPDLVVEVAGTERRSVMLPDTSSIMPTVPDLDTGATFTIPDGDTLKTGTRFTQQVNDAAALVASPDEAYMVAQTEVNRGSEREPDIETERRRAVLADSANMNVDGDRFVGFFSLDYLRDISKDVPRPASTEIDVEMTAPEGFGDDEQQGQAGPSYFAWDSRGALVKLMLAPRVRGRNDEEIDEWDLSSPGDTEPCLEWTDSVSLEQPQADESDLPGQALNSLRKAWSGYKSALAEDNERRAEHYACIINGIRAGHGLEPMAFDRLGEFTCNPLELAEPDVTAPPLVGTDTDGETRTIEPGDGDTVAWFFPKEPGCRCGAQALSFQQLADEQGAQVVGVSTEDVDTLRAFKERHDLTFPILSDPEGANGEAWGVGVESGLYDRTAVFIRDGEVTDRADGLALHAPHSGSQDTSDAHALTVTLGEHRYEVNRPEFERRTRDEWMKPALADFVGDSEWDDLPRDKRLEIGEHFMAWETGEPGERPAADYGDLQLPVVDPDGRLNLRALRNAKARAGQLTGIDQETLRQVQREINRLAGQFEGTNFRPVGEGTVELLEHFEHPSVAVITGKRGSGKSSTAFHLADELYHEEGRIPVVVGAPDGVRKHLPDYFGTVETLDQAPCNAVCVVDEAYTRYHSRRSMTGRNVEMSQLVNTSRHHNQSILFVAQNSGHLDTNAVGEADVLMMKEPGTFHERFERAKVRDLSKQAKQAFKQLPTDADPRGYTYVFADGTETLVPTAEAPFYGEGLSTSYSTACGLSQPAVDEASLCLPESVQIDSGTFTLALALEDAGAD